MDTHAKALFGKSLKCPVIDHRKVRQGAFGG